MFKELKWFILILLVVPITGCSNSKITGAQFGEKIPSTMGIVKLAQLSLNPTSYNQKEIVLEGTFGGICCDTDFFYKEGMDMIEVSPKDFPSPKIVIGTPIKIYGVVRAVGDKLNVEAKGVEVIK